MKYEIRILVETPDVDKDKEFFTLEDYVTALPVATAEILDYAVTIADDNATIV